MGKRKSYYSRFHSRRKKKSSNQWWEWIKNPLVQQALALVLIVLALLTALTLLNLTSGRWTNAWVQALRFLFGWGVIPITVAIGGAGFLILQHQLDQPVEWRWRPFVGLELVFFSLLTLTHLIGGRADPWGLIESGWGGGLVGWALSRSLSSYLGPLVTGVLTALICAFGMGLAFDVTVKSLQKWLQRLRKRPSPARSSRSPRRRRSSTSTRHTTAAPRKHTAKTRKKRKKSKTASKPPPAEKPTQSKPTPSPPPEQTPKPAPTPTKKPTSSTAVSYDGELERPTLDLLDEVEGGQLSDQEVREKSRIIVETLSEFGLPVQVVEVRRGPTVTQFGVSPGFTERGRRSKKVRVSQISALADDLALALAAPSLRIEAPVPGRPVVGIEVPNEGATLVTLRSVMEEEEFHNRREKSPLAIALGKDVAGDPVAADLGLMPHLLIAGTTGSGKSVCIKALATCLAMTNRPDELRMVMIDPKMVELVRFNSLPHLLGHTEYELDRVTRVLLWVAHEMDQRYKKFAEKGARNLDDYNRMMSRRGDGEHLPRITVFVDELADLMMLAPEQTERTVCRIAQMARATGIHLIIATQRPSTDVVTGLIKANFPARISFATASQVDSRVILDTPGAEDLLGNGDLLYLASDAASPRRIQGCFVDEREIERVVDWWKRQTPGWPTQPPWEQMVEGDSSEEGPAEELDPDDKKLLKQAISLVNKRNTISTSYLQRRLHVGYPRAARLMEVLEEMGLVGPQRSAGRPRRVIGGDVVEE